MNDVSAVVAIKDHRLGALIDFYPFGDTRIVGGFRLSGGYYLGKMNFAARGYIPNDSPAEGIGYEFYNIGGIRGRLM